MFISLMVAAVGKMSSAGCVDFILVAALREQHDTPIGVNPCLVQLQLSKCLLQGRNAFRWSSLRRAARDMA